MDEWKIEHLMKCDFSVGTEKFRDELLNRCLDELEPGVVELSYSDLDLVSAAGDPTMMETMDRLGDNTIQ